VNGSKDQEDQAQIPATLARFTAEEGHSVRHTLTLLHMQEQIAATRNGAGKRQEKVDWKEFYNDAMKKFL
jgi:hypothetical protein